MTPPHITLYGIPNCDTVKKARAWFDAQGLSYAFHDFKKQGVPDRLAAWTAAVGWEKLVNRQGTTWRRLDSQTQASVQDAASASALMQAQPSVIKRPVVEWSQGGQGMKISVGLAPDLWLAWKVMPWCSERRKRANCTDLYADLRTDSPTLTPPA